MRERKAVIKQTAARYRRSSKKQKAKILYEFIEITGYNRKYAGWILRNWGKKRYIRVDGHLIEVVIGTPLGLGLCLCPSIDDNYPYIAGHRVTRFSRSAQASGYADI